MDKMYLKKYASRLIWQYFEPFISVIADLYLVKYCLNIVGSTYELMLNMVTPFF